MNLYLLIAVSLGAYLLGSLSFARIVTRRVKPGTDISTIEAPLAGKDEKFVIGTVSATSVSKHLGKKFGKWTFLLDVLKVFLPTLVVRLLLTEFPYHLFVAVAGLIGHIWPVYYGFKGGRGVSIVYAGTLGVDWLGFLVTTLGGFVLGLFVFRTIWLIYSAGMFLLIPWFWFTTKSGWYVGYAVVVNVIIYVAAYDEARQFFKLLFAGRIDEFTSAMEGDTAMGRGLVKIAKKFGVM